MRFPVRVFFRCLSSILVFFLLLQSFTPLVSAQTEQITTPQQQSFTRPNVEDDVPLNQHTYIQAMFLELMIAIQCQLTGIDLANPTKSCLGVNLQTGKLGYAPLELYQNGQPPIGGVMGMLNNGIGTMYTPAFGTEDYIRYMASDFGIVKSTYAAYTGFEGLSPILGLWKATRDIAYYLLIIAFIFIGIGVMLRLKIDPRTVMTVQNQIPRVIICIILITFSYAISAVFIDVMWAVTYMGVNKITESGTGIDPTLYDCNGEKVTLGQAANTKILQTPFSFTNYIFRDSGCLVSSGVIDLSNHVSKAISAIELDLLREALGVKDGCDWDTGGAIGGALKGSTIFPGIGTAIGALLGGSENTGTCILTQGLSIVLGWAVLWMWFIIVTVIIIITLFRIWFELLKAYILVLLYAILGPLWIVFGLLPKKPLGFEKWLRVYFANMAVFPATVFLLVGARVLGDLFNRNPEAVFVPPLVGNPASSGTSGDPVTGYLGAIIEFGMLLMTPTLVGILREKLGVPQTKQFQQAMQTFNAGRQATSAPFKKAWAGLNRRNAQTGSGEAVVSRLRDTMGQKLTSTFVGQKGIFGYKPPRPDGKGGVKERWIDKVRREADERGRSNAAGRGRRTYDEVYGANNPDNPNVIARNAQIAAQAQQQLSAIIDTSAAPRRYTPAEWTVFKGETGRHMSEEQHEHVVEGILGTARGSRSRDEAAYLEQLSRGGLLSTDQKQRYEQETAQARSGQAGGNITITIQTQPGQAQTHRFPIRDLTQTGRDFLIAQGTDAAAQSAITQELDAAPPEAWHTRPMSEIIGNPQDRTALEGTLSRHAQQPGRINPSTRTS